MKILVLRFFGDETGATAIEYGLIASLVALAIIAGATTLGRNIGTVFNNIAANVH